VVVFVTLLIILFLTYLAVNRLLYEIAPLVSIITPYLQKLQIEQLSSLLQYVLPYLKNISDIFLHLFLIFIISYYFLIERDRIISLLELLPIEEKFFERIRRTLDALFYGVFLTSLIQAALSFIFFLILGYRFSLILSFLVFIAGVLPVLGVWTVWIPLGIYDILIGNIFRGMLSILLGVFLSFLGTILTPHLVSYKEKLHPGLILIGIIAGTITFGSIGIFLGPIILTLFQEYLEILKIKEKTNK